MVHTWPFSTSAFKVLIWIFATSTRCTKKPFDSFTGTLLHFSLQKVLISIFAPTTRCQKKHGLTASQEPFSTSAFKSFHFNICSYHQVPKKTCEKKTVANSCPIAVHMVPLVVTTQYAIRTQFGGEEGKGGRSW